MGRRWRARAIDVRALLVLLAFQGITPDSHDLASSSLLDFFQAPGDASSPVGRKRSPIRDGDEDTTVDEVCLAVRGHSASTTRPHAGGTPHREGFLSDQGRLPVRRDPSHLSFLRRSDPRHIDLILVLGRLIC